MTNLEILGRRISRQLGLFGVTGGLLLAVTKIQRYMMGETDFQDLQVGLIVSAIIFVLFMYFSFKFDAVEKLMKLLWILMLIGNIGLIAYIAYVALNIMG